MDFANLQLHITNHAFQQYCERVEEVEYGQLREQCLSLLDGRKYQRKYEFLNLDGTWWVYSISEESLRFVTCYGRSTFDLPKALIWAARHNDRIVLDHAE